LGEAGGISRKWLKIRGRENCWIGDSFTGHNGKKARSRALAAWEAAPANGPAPQHYQK
jgi:hypothetical protein